MGTVIPDLKPSSNQESLFSFEQFAMMASSVSHIVVDTEGWQYNQTPPKWRPMGFAIAFRFEPFGVVSRYFSWDHPLLPQFNIPDDQKAALKDLIENQTVVMHNAKHDWKDLASWGIRINKYRDTMLMVHMVDENLISKSLDYCTRHYGVTNKERPAHMQGIIDTLGWQYVPLEILGEYCKTDAIGTYELDEVVYPTWEAEGYVDLWENREAKFGRLVGDSLESWGIRIDQPLCEREIERGEARLSEIRDALNGRNPSSARDLEELLLGELGLTPVKRYTKKGKYSFDKYAMAEYDEMLSFMDNPVAKLVQEYRGYQKTVSSNWRSYLKFVDADGRLRPNYKLHGTVTRRLSCIEPNLQQIPRISDKPWNGYLKSGFIPDPGYELWEVDYSNLEFRLTAVYAGEQSLLEIFNEGGDVFQAIADEIYPDRPDRRKARQDAKTFVYATLYGAGAKKLMESLGLSSIQEAEELRNLFFSRYSRLSKTIRQAAMKCLKKGYVELWTGQRRHFDDRRADQHKAFNSVIQGGGAEIVKSAMLRLDAAGYNNDDCRMLMQVHDSVLFEIKSDMAVEMLPCIEKTMSDVEPIFSACTFKAKAKPWGSE